MSTVPTRSQRAGASRRSHPADDLPSSVAAVVEALRAGMGPLCRGRVLDLGGRAALAVDPGEVSAVDVLSELDGGPGLEGLARSGAADQRYDTVVAAARLLAHADLPEAIEAIDRLLAPDGHLLLAEPTRGWGHLPGLVASVDRRRTDIHLLRDVPRALRAGGFACTHLERITMPTRLLPLRPWVLLHAVRRTEVS